MVLLVVAVRAALPQDMMPLVQLAILMTIGAAGYLIVLALTARVQFRHPVELLLPSLYGAVK